MSDAIIFTKRSDGTFKQEGELPENKCDCGTAKEAVVWCYVHGYKIKPSRISSQTRNGTITAQRGATSSSILGAVDSKGLPESVTKSLNPQNQQDSNLAKKIRGRRRQQWAVRVAKVAGLGAGTVLGGHIIHALGE